MDMKRFVPCWINTDELQRIGGRYEGVIEQVFEQAVRNRFTGVKKAEPIIEFEDGYRLVPNITMRRSLMERFGTDTDLWSGERIAIELRRTSRTDPFGVITDAWRKHLLFPDDQPTAEADRDED
jgi:hypothetical protein